jgi:hypothetical protein
MFSDIDNARKMIELLGDEGFVEALTNAEELVDEVDETLDRVERVEDEAGEAVREANEALNAVDARLETFDETVRLLEAKIEAGFSVGFFFFAVSQATAGNLLIGAALAFMGLLGASSLVVSIITMPQVRRLRELIEYASDRVDEEEPEVEVRTRREAEARRETGATDEGETTPSGRRGEHRGANQSRRETETDQGETDQEKTDQGETDQEKTDQEGDKRS